MLTVPLRPFRLPSPLLIPEIPFSVTGTCIENITTPFTAWLTLDGNTTAVIHGPNSNNPTVAVWAEGTIIKRFSTISGGQDGIRLFSSGTATIDSNTIQSTGRDGVLLGGGGAATINNNTIKNTGRYGVAVFSHSYATITNNRITNNPGDGISVAESSAARIGFNYVGDTVASPNTIDSNGGDGIVVSDNSNAGIVGNTISNNTGNGITVDRVAHADISSNTINNNQGDGVEVNHGSGANLGSHTGTTIFDLPNTTTVNNGALGISCDKGGYVAGPLGTLNGAEGPTIFTNLCMRADESKSSTITVNADYFGGPTWAKLYGIAINNMVGFAFDSTGMDPGMGGGGLFRFARGSYPSRAAVQDGDRVGFFAFAGYDGTNFLNTAAFTAKIDGPVSANNVPTKFVFETNATGFPRPERMVISSSGNVGIGTSTPSNPLHMGSGAYVSTGGVWTNASSREYKDNIQALATEEALNTLKELNPVKFAYKTDRTEKHLGFIAEEVPDLIATKDRKGLSPMDIVAVLTKVIQDQQKIISAHSEKIAELERALQLRGALTAVSDSPQDSLR